MTAIFGRNRGFASGPYGDIPVESQRFHAVVDNDLLPAVYDAFTGRFAPGLDAEAALDLNNDQDNPERYQWKDSL